MRSMTARVEPPPPPPPEVEYGDLEEFPELATNDYWRATMRRARGSRELTQKQLGARVGISQNVISQIESGEQRASKAILPICNILRIAPPVAMIADMLDERWFNAGQEIRRHGTRFYEAQIEAMERLAASLGETRDS